MVLKWRDFKSSFHVVVSHSRNLNYEVLVLGSLGFWVLFALNCPHYKNF